MSGCLRHLVFSTCESVKLSDFLKSFRSLDILQRGIADAPARSSAEASLATASFRSARRRLCAFPSTTAERGSLAPTEPCPINPAIACDSSSMQDGRLICSLVLGLVAAPSDVAVSASVCSASSAKLAATAHSKAERASTGERSGAVRLTTGAGAGTDVATDTITSDDSASMLSKLSGSGSLTIPTANEGQHRRRRHTVSMRPRRVCRAQKRELTARSVQP